MTFRPKFELGALQNRALELVTEVAREKGCRPFLVGGPVRDLLLGRSAIDVDLTLEDGSSTLARALARKIEGRVRSYPQFLTYKVTADGLPEIDIATTRKERYRSPGALPAVAPGKLRDDLLRRDFSINAMALDLLDGSLHDPTGGERDLADRVVRVLHSKSFVDDPTRIYRAIRLGTRLGFRIEDETARLMHEAVERDAPVSVSRERLWREVFLAMDEESAPAVLRALDDHGALAAVTGGHLLDEARRGLDHAQAAIASRPDLDRHVLYTGMLLRGNDGAAASLDGAGFSQKRARGVLQIARELSRLHGALAAAQSDRHRFRLLKSVCPETRAILAAERTDASAHISRFEDFQRFKLPLRGNELEVPGGPHVARALERTREAVFTGEIRAEDARAFARELAIQYLSREQPGEVQ